MLAALGFDEAIEGAPAGRRSTATATGNAVVSYEIGTLLERQLGDVELACAHWLEHRRRYPSGRYDAIVARSLARLRCDAAE